MFHPPIGIVLKTYCFLGGEVELLEVFSVGLFLWGMVSWEFVSCLSVFCSLLNILGGSICSMAVILHVHSTVKASQVPV